MRRLHRFPLSHFSEKARLLLSAKALPHEIVEHRLGPPQVAIWRLSGQRKVPVLEETELEVVSDSTRIALFLERRFPESGVSFLPDDPAEIERIRSLEDRIDRVLGFGAPTVWAFDLLSKEPAALSDFHVDVWTPMPGAGALLGLLGRGLAPVSAAPPLRSAGERTRLAVAELLAELGRALRGRPFLAGDRPGLADVAAAGLTLHLDPEALPSGLHPAFSSVSLPQLVGDDDVAHYFARRRALYEAFGTVERTQRTLS